VSRRASVRVMTDWLGRSRFGHIWAYFAIGSESTDSPLALRSRAGLAGPMP
jgi:hypothetical protein